ncbi:MAG TPA: asparagine synthase-related protein, partial [Novosphingobium sp.]|nr:asparagine synthase-related protein [Novosphingobium sp.]
PPGHFAQAQRFGRAVLAWADPARGREVGAGSEGWQVLFAGQLHNRKALMGELGLSDPAPEAVYAAALDRWGTAADDHCIGHYAAIAIAPDGASMRLARSPFLAPPLHFRQADGAIVAAQRPRELFWNAANRPEPDLERVGQVLVNDASDRFRSWYRSAHRLPLGSAVVVRSSGWDEIWRYDLFTRPQQRMARRSDYAEAAQALLDDGVGAVLEGVRKPAIMLSGGLDSPLVAASILRQLGPDQRLEAFTFGPSSEWAANAPPGIFCNDFEPVAAFAQMHPRLSVHFETNPGRDFRFGQRELLEASDAAPSSLGLAWIEHSSYAAAGALGCDAMLCGTWGNFGFSSRGPWAYSEFLRRGKWDQLYRALKARVGDQRPLWRQFAGLALAPLLPRPIWQFGKRLVSQATDRLLPVAIRPDWPELEATLQRSRAAGFDFERLQFSSRTAHWRALLAEDGQEQDQYALGMELMHGLPKRDPTAYRPLIEFCWGCPTDVFIHQGTDRWLAREMAKGQMPEDQRLNRAYGHHFVDWQPRLAAIRDELLDELERMADDPDIASVVDIPRLQQLVAAIPERADGYDPQTALPYQTALPIGMAAARFIAYAKGRNDI